MKKIAIIGADGFIGRRLTLQLAADPNNSILAFDRFHKFEVNHPLSGFSNVEIISGDFLNRSDVQSVVSDVEFVFHMVSTTNPATAQKDPFIDIDTNIKGSVALFEACASASVKKVIFPSSGGTVYGNQIGERISENAVPYPHSPYGIGKLTIEYYLRYFKFTRGLDYLIYRVSNPFGPGQNVMGKQGVIPIFLHKILLGEPLTVFGDGEMVRDYIYIDDLINMIVGSCFGNTKYHIYNIGSGTGSSVNQIIEALRSCVNKEIKVTHQAQPASFVQNSVLDTDRFLHEFNINPVIDLISGISKTWNYVAGINL